MRIQYLIDAQSMKRLQEIAAANAYTLNTGRVEGKIIRPIRRGQAAWRADKGGKR